MMFRAVQIREYERGMLYRAGRFVRILTPGRYRIWQALRHESVAVVDTRWTTLAINGQEMVTADKIGLRLNLVASYRVTDPVAALHTVASYTAQVYQELQLALREVVAGTALDTLMAEKTQLSAALRDGVAPITAAFGVELGNVGVKDVVLPGEVKRMLSQEAEAERAGRAALIAARSETATTRNLVNAARLLAENPALMRLKEIQSLAEVAREPGNTVVLTLPPSLLGALGARGGSSAPSE
jgi:regulator of protease activity HflC (stomatin/prohibitin superfamily)